ncbi:zinc finger protein [Diplodia corticola]|uniref:Zinc finger protein n=1 Tax=Diplodia corticola TaxID=236234 RepID=A0A1J9S2E9_9PEZI|nr:zinc finger protein [Diplodia corticola]OJD34180.1 zinc finger protein [Diplodia corticola]
MAAPVSALPTPLPAATSPFDQALARFKGQLSDKEIVDFQLTSAEDLKRAILQLQKTQAGEKRMQNLHRLTAFVEAMDQFDKVVQVFLNASDYLGFIWGPAKFMLLVAGSHADALNMLLEAYQQIGEHMPLLPQYESLTISGLYLHQVLGFLYTDILEFHCKALKHFRQRAWKQLFHATWKTFRANFDGILSNLRFHRELLDSQVTLVGVQETAKATQELREMRRSLEAQWQQTQNEEAERRKRAVTRWLSVEDITIDHDDALAVLEKNPQSGSWLFQQDLIRDWLDPQSFAEPLLWINGKPGAGKTILASVIIEKCRSIPTAAVAYFYCKHDRPDRNNFVAFSCSLILQLSYLMPSLQAFIVEKMSSSGTEKLRSPKTAKEILEVAFKAVDCFFLIIDGIDECPKAQKNEIGSWARSSFSSSLSNQSESLRCCFLSQDDKETGRLFKAYPTLRITTQHNNEEIAHYCRTQVQEIGTTFRLQPEDIRGLAALVCEKADGMFLYAKLVMENLSNQVSRAMLKKEMGKIPPTLNEIYDRILHRLLHESSSPDQQITKTLLSWLLCAKRPLKWHEIQGSMCLDLDDGSFDPDRRLVRDIKHFCGSLVELRQGGAIDFVHLTARFFLQDQAALPRQLEELNMTRICFSCLTLNSHDPDISNEFTRQCVLRGEYAFTEYAILHAFDHLYDLCLQFTAGSCSDYTNICATLRTFLARRVNASTKRVRPAKSVDNCLAIFQSEPFFQDLRHAAADTKQLPDKQSRPTDDGPLTLALQAQLQCVRSVMEKMITVSRLGDHLEPLYGGKIFKCSDMQCHSFHEGFSKEAARDKHCWDHERTWTCSWSGCPSSVNGFSSAGELEKHKHSHHVKSHDDTTFPWNGNLASLDIRKEIRNGNFAAFELWISQWEGKLTRKDTHLWFDDYKIGKDSGVLHTARQSGQQEMLEKMFDKIDWSLVEPRDAKFFFQRTLHSRDERTAERLLKVYGNLTEANIYGFLRTATNLGLDATAAELLKYPSSALSNPKKKQRHTGYLNLAIRDERREIERQLLTAYRVDPNLEDDKGRISMNVAAEYNRTDMAKYLTDTMQCDKWATDRKGRDALSVAGRLGHESFILSIFRDEQQEPKVRLWLRTAQFRSAVCNGDDRKVLELLDGGDLNVDEVDSGGNSPWLWAVKKGHARIVEIFLDRRETSKVSFKRRYRTGYDEKNSGGVVHCAAFHGFDLILRILLQSSKFDSELDRSGGIMGYGRVTPLQLAKEMGHEAAAQVIEEYTSSLRNRQPKQPPYAEPPAREASTPDSRAPSPAASDVDVSTSPFSLSEFFVYSTP